MAKYRCEKSKDEILEIIVKHFEKANKDSDTVDNDLDFGRYVGLLNLLIELKVYEN